MNPGYDGTMSSSDCPGPSPGTLRVVFISDSHLGASDSTRNSSSASQDAILALHESFRVAHHYQADLIIHGGDLFHVPSPPVSTLSPAIDLFRDAVLGQGAIKFTARHEKVPTFNFMSDKQNVRLPVFIIHGNHDIPPQAGRDAAIESLASAGLVNLLPPPEILPSPDGDIRTVWPLLLEKGPVKVAIWAVPFFQEAEQLASVVQGRLHFERATDPSLKDYFKVIQVHVLRSGRGHVPCVTENLWPQWADLVSYAHEHECVARLSPNAELIPPALAPRLDQPYTPLMQIGDEQRYWMQTGSGIPVTFGRDELCSRYVHVVDFIASQQGLPLPLRALSVPLQLQRSIVDIALAVTSQGLQAVAGFEGLRQQFELQVRQGPLIMPSLYTEAVVAAIRVAITGAQQRRRQEFDRARRRGGLADDTLQALTKQHRADLTAVRLRVSLSYTEANSPPRDLRTAVSKQLGALIVNANDCLRLHRQTVKIQPISRQETRMMVARGALEVLTQGLARYSMRVAAAVDHAPQNPNARRRAAVDATMGSIFEDNPRVNKRSPHQMLHHVMGIPEWVQLFADALRLGGKQQVAQLLGQRLTEKVQSAKAQVLAPSATEIASVPTSEQSLLQTRMQEYLESAALALTTTHGAAAKQQLELEEQSRGLPPPPASASSLPPPPAGSARRPPLPQLPTDLTLLDDI